MSLRVDDFKAQLIGGGARPNLYRCTMTNPGVGAGVPVELASFMCKGAQLPASTVANIDVPFRGRQIKIAGDRTFENWTATIFNEGSFAVRDSFERWMNALNGHISGVQESTNPADYQAQILVEQLDRQEEVLKEYVIEGAFPVNVSAIDLAYDSNDAIEEFTVEFAYQYWNAGTVS
jgi:hypothetical protein